MIEIKDLLARFNNILFSEEGKMDSVRKIISETIGIEIKKDNLKIKNRVIFLNIKPIYKNEVFLKKEQIFIKFKEIFGDKSPEDIR